MKTVVALIVDTIQILLPLIILFFVVDAGVSYIHYINKGWIEVMYQDNANYLAKRGGGYKPEDFFRERP